MEQRKSEGRGNFGGRSNFNNRNDFDRRPAEKHKAVCSSCKQECEVPFKPTEGRDVFCTDCFKKNNPRPNNFRR
ncbi:MAG: DNA-directed RNA polymerase [archaeon]|nr:DNA-directed RNA polymerase [archaeon]MCR4323582.1 DNA-directed RNA polymerase [Nanoarchaeota archaeon]